MKKRKIVKEKIDLIEPEEVCKEDNLVPKNVQEAILTLHDHLGCNVRAEKKVGRWLLFVSGNIKKDKKGKQVDVPSTWKSVDVRKC
jgi:hypothetical protein